MHLFFSNTILNKQIELDAEESRHLSKVLRLKVGDSVEAIDGKGNLYACKVLESHPKKSSLSIIETSYKEEKFNIHLAVAPTKNLNRWEWFLEKVTEIGIDQISPIKCNHSERQVLKMERQVRILISAMKQSQKATLPKLEELQDFSKFLETDFEGEKYIAHCETSSDKMSLVELHPKGKKALILIGPEGDFSPDEIASAKAKGFKEISLGTSRLRTETAAIVACHTITLINA